MHPPLASGVLAATMALDALALGEAVTGRRTPGAHRLATYTLGLGLAANVGAAAKGSPIGNTPMSGIDVSVWFTGY